MLSGSSRHSPRSLEHSTGLELLGPRSASARGEAMREGTWSTGDFEHPSASSFATHAVPADSLWGPGAGALPRAEGSREAHPAPPPRLTAARGRAAGLGGDCRPWLALTTIRGANHRHLCFRGRGHWVSYAFPGLPREREGLAGPEEEEWGSPGLLHPHPKPHDRTPLTPH